MLEPHCPVVGVGWGKGRKERGRKACGETETEAPSEH